MHHRSCLRPHPHYLPCAAIHGQITAVADSLRAPGPKTETPWSTFRRTATSQADSSLRTLTAISIAHWVSHFHLLVLPMLFPFLKAQLGVGYVELGFALTVLAVVSGLTQAPTGYLVDHSARAKSCSPD